MLAGVDESPTVFERPVRSCVGVGHDPNWNWASGKNWISRVWVKNVGNKHKVISACAGRCSAHCMHQAAPLLSSSKCWCLLGQTKKLMRRLRVHILMRNNITFTSVWQAGDSKDCCQAYMGGCNFVIRRQSGIVNLPYFEHKDSIYWWLVSNGILQPKHKDTHAGSHLNQQTYHQPLNSKITNQCQSKNPNGKLQLGMKVCLD